MNSSDDRFAALWRELIAAGLISATRPQPLGGGNSDRAESADRSSWRAQAPDGLFLKLTIGKDLADTFARASGFHAQLPEFTLPPRFHHRGQLEVVGEEFLDAVSLETLVSSNAVDSRHASSLDALATALIALNRPSCPEARDFEWTAWSDEVLRLPVWDPSSRRLLADTLLPALRHNLGTDPPSLRWIHGDLIGRNLLFDQSGAFRLIDCEFANETHFPVAEIARFHALTPQIDRIAGQLPAAWSTPSVAAQLLFWIQQIQREASHNRPEYLERWLPDRLARLHHLAEALTDTSILSSWRSASQAGRAESAAIHFHLEEARWLVDSPKYALRFTGWCHDPLALAPFTSVVALVQEHLLARVAFTARPDVQAHFDGHARALLSGFVLELPPVDPGAELRLAAETHSGERQTFWTVIAGDLPGRGPVHCFYSNWAAIADPDPALSTIGHSAIAFSLLLPIYNTPADLLCACFDSVRAQHYTHWKLHVVDDASSAPHVASLIHEYAQRDPRIFVHQRTANGGISRATNDALAAATGDFIVLVDHDDILRPHALAELAIQLKTEPDLDLVYSDEDKLSPSGTRILPLLKPAFSPEYLRGVMYVGHVLCVRTSLAREVGGFDPGFDGIQDYEFVLRLSERTTRIRHLPRILYHWRQSPSSSALVSNIKGDIDSLQTRAVQAHLARSGDRRCATALGGHRVRLDIGVPFPSLRQVRYAMHADPVQTLIDAARQTKEDIILLIDERSPALLSEIISHLTALASLPDSAFVSAVLVSREHFVLESGLTLSPDGRPIPVMNGFDASGDGLNGSLLCNREVVAVSPWCVAIRRTLLEEPITATTWIQLCGHLRSRKLYHRVCAAAPLVLPYGWRTYPIRPDLGTSRESDPFYNPHLCSEPADYRLSPRPRHNSGSVQPIVARLETAPSLCSIGEGALSLRGWAFHVEGQSLHAHLTAGDLKWSVGCDLLRPDVAEAHPAFGATRSGFAFRIRLPAGRHRVSVEIASISSTDSLELFAATIRVPLSAPLRRIFIGTPASLVATQFLAGPSHSARLAKPERFPRWQPSTAQLRLAIATPSYQQVHYLGQCIRSVLAQRVACDYSIQDGGSPDGSIALIKGFSSQLHSWESTRDSGQADAIRRAFTRLTGAPEDLMAWINSDDFYLPGALAYVQAYFAHHPEVDVLYGHRIVVDERSHEIGRWFVPPHDDEVLRLNDFVPQETMFWRRRIWDKVGGIDTSFKFAMDWDLLLRFQAAGAKIVRVPYFLACFRVHSAQKTSSQMESVGQKEIDLLRQRTFGRILAPEEIENHPRLIRYLRKSAWIEFLWRRFRIRHP